jgi:peptidoglycan/LPS O-acetylase OafA/YrhL
MSYSEVAESKLRIYKNDKVFFPNLNGLRFLAAFAVMISHVEIMNHFAGFGSIVPVSLLYNLGRLGVIMFFVLSGFLITFLLLSEEKLRGSVSIGKFYWRRILKIWPLYFFIVGLSFFVIPHLVSEDLLSRHFYDHFYLNLALFVLFLPNVANSVLPLVQGASQAWSIGTEEQFYLIWPLLFKIKINRVKLFFLFLIAYEFVKFGMFRFIKRTITWNDSLQVAREIWDKSFTVQCMAIGGIFAFFLFERNKIFLKIAFSRVTLVVVGTVTAYLVTSNTYILNFNDEVFSLLFAVIILNLAANPKNVIHLENRVFNYLGKISYGIYMYHSIVILFYKNSIVYPIHFLIEWAIIFSMTVLVSAISYEWFEKRFIKLKSRYSIVNSGA